MLLSLGAIAGGVPAAQPDPMEELITRLREPAAAAGRVHAHPDNRRTLIEVYERRRDALLWSSAGIATAPAEALVELLRAAPDYGLIEGDYDAERLAAQLRTLGAEREAPAAQWAAFDVALSNSALTMLHDLHFGRVEAQAAGFDLPRRRERFDEAAYLEELAVRSDPAAVLAEVEPDFLHYRLLRHSLSRYRRLAAASGLTALPPLHARSVGPGERYAGAPALRRLLATLGDLPAEQAARSDTLIDAGLSAALKRFEYRHGLPADGALGKGSFAALTVPLAQRVRQVELTLERWRWVPPLEAPTLIVHIPQFRLFLFRSAVDSEADMLRMSVIVGHGYPQLHTPVFAADMNAIVFRPYWDVPPTLVRERVLPELARDPRYLEVQDLELIGPGAEAAALPPSPENLSALAAGRLRLRQRPGPDNVLGLVKFVLPSFRDVYLHATPARPLSDELRRAFSDGGIRVSDPVALAADVLRGTPGDWTAAKIRAAMNGGTTLRLALAQPVQVLILYGTAVASEDGALHFFDDIYGYDRRLEALLGLRPITARE